MTFSAGWERMPPAWQCGMPHFLPWVVNVLSPG